MKKKCLAMLLAAVLAVSLLPTAFAADATGQDAPEFFTIYRNGTVDETKGDYLSDAPVKFMFPGDEGFTEHNYHVISKSDSWIITNTGNGNVTINLNILPFTEYEGNWGYLHNYSLFSLEADGRFVYWQNELEEIEAGNDPRLFLKPGETVTISASAFIEADSIERDFSPIYSLSFMASSGSYYSFDFLIDEARKAQIDASLVQPETPTTPAFTDVPNWCAAEAAWAVERGITKGTGNNQFSPNRTCTDAEILTFLYRAAGEQKAASPSPFTVESWCQDAIDWAYEQKLIDTSFRADAPCTRATALSYIWRALGSEPSNASGSGFTDVSSSAGYAGAVAWAVEKGITKGTGDGSTFSPDKTCGRGEIVTFLYRAYA